MAMRPRSFPLYAFATSNASKNVPTMCPCPLEHSKTKVTKHRLGYISRVYDPLVTATSKPLAMESCSQDSPPVTIRCSHSHVFPHNQRTPRKDVGAQWGLARGSEDVRCQRSPPRVDSTELIVMRWLLGWLCEWWNLFGFLPNTNTSSMMSSALRWCRVESSPFHVHWQILWVGPMNCPTRVQLLQLEQMESIALLHIWKSESKGCLFGHVMFNRASPEGRRDSTSGLILFPDAMRMSNMNSSCWHTFTQFRWWSVSLEYPLWMSTCMMNWSPLRGNARLKSATTAFMLNLDNFS